MRRPRRCSHDFDNAHRTRRRQTNNRRHPTGGEEAARTITPLITPDIRALSLWPDGVVHTIRCPECGIELCADPGCRIHPPEQWVSRHAEMHYAAMKALLRGENVRRLTDDHF